MNLIKIRKFQVRTHQIYSFSNFNIKFILIYRSFITKKCLTLWLILIYKNKYRYSNIPNINQYRYNRDKYRYGNIGIIYNIDRYSSQIYFIYTKYYLIILYNIIDFYDFI